MWLHISWSVEFNYSSIANFNGAAIEEWMMNFIQHFIWHNITYQCWEYINKRLCKKSRRRWFETPSRPLRRHCNVVQLKDENVRLLRLKLYFFPGKISPWRHLLDTYGQTSNISPT